jgi:germination protein YpeB
VKQFRLNDEFCPPALEILFVLSAVFLLREGFFMQKTVSKFIIITLSIIVAGTVAILGLELRKQHFERDRLERMLDAAYSRSFNTLSSSVFEMNSSLQKMLYSQSDAALSALCTDVYAASSSAHSALSELPFSDTALDNTSAFLVRTGNYSFSMLKKLSGGSLPSDDERNTLTKLSQAAAVLSQNLTDMQAAVENGEVALSALSGAESETGEVKSLSSSFELLETEFPEIPTLIYDGPFSQHIKSDDPALLSGRDELSEEECRKRAAEFCETNAEYLTLAYETSGDIPCYCFTDEAGELTVSVTKKGGEIFSFLKTKEHGEKSKNAEDAAAMGKKFLEKRLKITLRDSYWTIYENSILINFAPMQGEYICYPDLIKISVALDTGEVIAYDAAGYISSHKKRAQPDKEFPEIEAKKRVSDRLKILSHEMAIIPSAGKNELFCHEFKCESAEGEHYIVYINAVTGEEEKILILLENENGILTI